MYQAIENYLLVMLSIFLTAALAGGFLFMTFWAVEIYLQSDVRKHFRRRKQNKQVVQKWYHKKNADKIIWRDLP